MTATRPNPAESQEQKYWHIVNEHGVVVDGMFRTYGRADNARKRKCPTGCVVAAAGRAELRSLGYQVREVGAQAPGSSSLINRR